MRDNTKFRQISLIRDFLSKEVKHKLPSEERRSLYLSDHLLDRIVERNLTKDVAIIAAMISYFHREVFKKTTFTHRSFLVEFKKLKVVFQICYSLGLDGKPVYRQTIVKTAFENEEMFECDERIVIK